MNHRLPLPVALMTAALALGSALSPARAATTAPAMDKTAMTQAWTVDKDALEKALGTGHDKAFYRTVLEKAGYWITAVNKDTADRLEYEIVKGDKSYEVQVDFDKGTSTRVDVTTNLWKAPGTRTALKDRNYAYQYPKAVTADADKVRDSVRQKTWIDEKGRMEAALGTGHDRAHYRRALEKMGYKVTAVNESDPKNLEYEVVKGDTSYEVQVDFDDAGRSTRVGVSSNVWESAATEKAKRD